MRSCRPVLIVAMLAFFAPIAGASTLTCGPADGLPADVCRTIDYLDAPVLAGSNGAFIDLAKFDLRIGMLTSVTVTLLGISDVTAGEIPCTSPGVPAGCSNPYEGYYFTRSGQDAAVGGNILTDMTLRSPGGTVIVVSTPFVAIGSRTDMQVVPVTGLYPTGSGQDSQSRTYSGAAIPSFFYAGAGGTMDPLPLRVASSFDGRTYDANSINGGSARGDDESLSRVMIDYTFVMNEVPEPATLLLIGSSLVGLGLMARRRKRT